MKSLISYLQQHIFTLCLLLLFAGNLIFSASASGQDMVVSSYYNAGDPRDEWIELLVITDNLDISGWSFGDDNATQTSPQPRITFQSIPFWQHLRAGTIIVIWNRPVTPALIAHPSDLSPDDGFLQLSATNPAYFSGGDLGTAPGWAGGNSLVIAGAGDLISLRNAANLHVHALGHRVGPGTSYLGLGLPKLNHTESLGDGEVIAVCPGTNLNLYGTQPPQSNTVFTNRSAVNTTQGLPNISTAYPLNNTDYWRSLRQPNWPAINPAFLVNPGNTAVTLSWTPVEDNYQPDLTTGYLILRNTTNTFTEPLDGTRYNNGDLIGSATVVWASLPNSLTSSYTDNLAVPCTDGLYYRVYAFRYTTDNNGINGFHPARGRAYNETQFAEIHATVVSPVDIVDVVVDQTGYCAGTPPTEITLTANGGSGETLEWFAGTGCSGTSIGMGTPFVVNPAPAATTTYSAHWNTAHCGVSACEEVTVTVYPDIIPTVSIAANPGTTVCQGTPVTVTATPANSGTPAYQWYLNGNPAGANQDTYTFTPGNADVVYVIMTSAEPCSGGPLNSNTLTFTVNTLVPPSVTIDPIAPSVCTGSDVTFTANPTNGGGAPEYEWFLNGTSTGLTGPIYLLSPTNGDQVYVAMTSDEPCVSVSGPVNSNTETVTVTTSYTVGVSIIADDTDVCDGTSVEFTATPASGGSTLTYAWYVNTVAVPGEILATYSYLPVDGDVVYATLTDAATCATGSPATSNSLAIVVHDNVVVDVSITVDNPAPCEGTAVEFTATPAFPGTAPLYEWYVNGALQTVPNLPTFTYNSPVDGDLVWVVLTSSEACTSVNGVQSASIVMTVLPQVTPGVTLAADQTSICTGSAVTFTATPSDPGTNPQYIFNVNGTPQAPQSDDFFIANPGNGDTYSVTLISSAACLTSPSVNSNQISITVSSSLPVSVTLPAIGFVCSGTPAVLEAFPVNQGASPVYEWYLNGAFLSSSILPTLSIPAPIDGDQVFVRLINSESCATGSPFDSPIVTITVVNSEPAGVSIGANLPQVCSGSEVIFTATPVNGGALPVYAWFVDGLEQTGFSSETFPVSPVADISVYAVMTSNAVCAQPGVVTSIPVNITVTASYLVSVTAVPFPLSVCEGESTRFTAEGLNEGPAPTYQWYLNGSAVTGETNAIYNMVPAIGDDVYVELTNNEACAIQHTVASPVVPVQVSSPVPVSLTVQPGQTEVCAGTEVVYTAIPANEGTTPAYAWYVNGGLQTGTGGTFQYTPAQGDLIYAVLTSSEACITNNPAQAPDVSVAVVTGPEVLVTLSSDAGSVCQGEPVTFTAVPENEGTTPVYRWLVNGVIDPSSAGETFQAVPADGDLVTVEVTSSEVCATNNPAIVGETVAISPCGFILQMPTAFTPDGNTINDIFKPVLGDIMPSSYLFQVFNRWGEVVFETSAPDQGWDGSFQGQPSPRGVYAYKVTFKVPEYITNSVKSPLRGTMIMLR